MMTQCIDKLTTDNIATIFERIPGANSESIKINSLCPLSTPGNSLCSSCTNIVLAFLRVFDAVRILEDGTEIKIKAKSQSAFFFLKSMGLYIRNRLIFISNWEDNIGVIEYLLPSAPFISGAQLVYMMEHKRISEHKDTSPIRQEFVSQVIIKAKLRGRSKPVYLVQYDERAHQYQLIGGRKNSSDNSALDTMKREIAEELSANHFLFNENYELKELTSDMHVKALSKSYGAYTEYHFTFYLAFIKSHQLILQPNDKWVTQKELFSGTGKTGIRISGLDYIKELDNKLPGGLEHLPLSLTKVQKRPLLAVLKERIWDLIKLIIGILGM